MPQNSYFKSLHCQTYLKVGSDPKRVFGAVSNLLRLGPTTFWSPVGGGARKKMLPKRNRWLNEDPSVGATEVTMIEGDTLEELYNATADFKLGTKAQYIDIVDTVCGIKAPPVLKG